MILSGDSAGGSLTLVTSLALRAKPASLPVISATMLKQVMDGKN